jgi:hypothetical protein
MRYLLNNKIYDTEKAEKIMTYIKPVQHEGLFNIITYPRYIHTLYKTAKGQFFVHIGKYIKDSSIDYQDKDYIELLTEENVKEILNRLNQVDKYEELFDDLEEG